MIVDVALNPRVAQLLGRIEETRRLAQEHPEDHPARVALEERIDGFYAEVGRYVHWLVRQDPAALARLAEEGRRWADDLGEQIRVELIPQVSEAEVEIDDLPDDESVDVAASEMPVIELTGDSRVENVDVRSLVDVPDDDGADATEPEPLEVGEDLEEITESDVAVVDDDAQLDVAIAVRTGSFPVPKEEPTGASSIPARPAVTDADDGEWLNRLRDLLVVLGPPEGSPDAPADRPAVVRSVALATTNLEVRWAVFPDAVQQALLGLVGARARRLDEEVASDPDVRLAIGRMRRFAEQRGLGLVPALREAVGVHRNWSADERRYWAVLNTGM